MCFKIMMFTVCKLLKKDKHNDKHNVNTRFATRTTFYVPQIRTNNGKFNIRFNGPILWNEIDERFKILTPYSFKSELSMHFINLY